MEEWEEWKKKYTEEERLIKAKKALDNLMTDRGDEVKGVPMMLTARDIMLIFWLSYRPALRFIHRYLAPIGGVVKLGKQVLVHPFAVQRLLNTVGRCPQCGRHWDDKLVLQELQDNQRGPYWIRNRTPDPRSYEEALKDLWGDEEDAKGGEAA
jgi:hypothetical protein